MSRIRHVPIIRTSDWDRVAAHAINNLATSIPDNGVILTDYMFGAVDGNDNADAIEAWADYVWNKDVGYAACLSTGTLPRAITVGGATNSLTKNIRFGPTLTATAQMDAIVTIQNCRSVAIDHSACTLVGGPGTALSDRYAAYGIRWHNCRGMIGTGKVAVSNCYYWGGVVYDGGTVNNNYAQLPVIQADFCGSSKTVGGTSALTATWNTPTRPGSIGSTGQTSTIIVNAVPRTDNILQRGLLAWIDGYPYSVTATADNGDGTWTLTIPYPWLSDALIAAGSGTLDYTFGGKCAIRGSNSNRIRILGIDGSDSAISHYDNSQYGSIVEHLANNGGEDVWYMFGSATNGSHLGGEVNAGYIEGSACPAQVISLSATAAERVRIGRVAATDFDFAKWFKHGPRATDAIPLYNQAMSEIIHVDGWAGKTIVAERGTTVSATWDPPSVAAGGSTTTTLTVAANLGFGFPLRATFNQTLSGCTLSAYVSANAVSSSTVTVVLSNPTAGAVDLASGTLTVTLLQ